MPMGMKRNRSTASPLSSSGPSKSSSHQTTSNASAKRLRRSESDESVVTILDSDDEANDKENQVPHNQPPKVKTSKSSGTNPHSALRTIQISDLTPTSAAVNNAQSEQSDSNATSKPMLTSSHSGGYISSSQPSESSAVDHNAPSPSGPNGQRNSSGALTSDQQSIDEFEGDVEEMSEPEDEQDPTTEPSASQHEFSCADYDTLLGCCSRPRNRLRVQHKSRTLDNAAFFELLMSVRAIDLCISRIYPVRGVTTRAKQSLVDLQRHLFGKTSRVNLSQLTKCVLMDAVDYVKQSERDRGAANYFLDLVKYLVEIFVYMESLAFLRFRVFEMKLQELYEASSGNLPAYLAMVVKLKQPMQQNQMDREPFRDVNLHLLGELKRVPNDAIKREYRVKHELAGELVDWQTTGNEGSEETDTLVDQLQSVEHLNQLDPDGKVQVIKQLVDLIMFDGITYRAYINGLESKIDRELGALIRQNKKLKETEAKYKFTRPAEADREDMVKSNKDDSEQPPAVDLTAAFRSSKRTLIHPAQAQYLRDLKHYRKSWQTYQETKQELECVVRLEPVCSVSAVTNSDIQRLNMWSFENLMPNYLIAESTKQKFASGASKTSWFQISNVNEFTRSLKALLPAAEFNQINRSISKLNTGHRKPEANTVFDATAPFSLDFLSRLTEFQASRKSKGSAYQADELPTDDDEDEDDVDCEVSTNSQLVADTLYHADCIYQDLYERLLVSNLHRWKATNGQSQGENVERYEIEIGEEIVKLIKTWPDLVAKYKKARSRADKAGLDQAGKEKLLLVMSVMCQTLLDSLHQNTKALPVKFFGGQNLRSVLHDYVLVNCRSFQFLGLFVAVLKNNIQWEHSLENTECQICHETRIKDGSLTDNTKIQCAYCSACFHYGCLTYEEDESKITFFTFRNSHLCSICIKSGDREFMESLEVE